MITLESVIRFIAAMISGKFYGVLTIRFEDGNIKHIERTEKFIKL
jgi:hypothetical protein